MAYLDVITLDQAKLYLRVDDTLTEDDSQITSMIEAALTHIENITDVFVFARNNEYLFTSGISRVYTTPINTVLTPLEADMTIQEKTLYTNYCYSGTGKLTLNVGYTDPLEVPADLRQVAFEIIDILYYGAGDGRALTNISQLSQSVLNKYRRFII